MSSGAMGLDLRIMKTEDKVEVSQFLRKHFRTDEPLSKCLNMARKENPTNRKSTEVCFQGLEDGLSLMCFRDEKLIGVVLNSYKEKKEPVLGEEHSKIGNLLDYVSEKSDPFQKYPECDKAMAINIVSVDGTFRRKGIATLLIEESKELAKQNGCGFIKVDCTSYYTAAAVKRLSFELIYSLDYADYRVNGVVLFEPESPHDAIRVYAMRIN